jgi:hypothetical protein
VPEDAVNAIARYADFLGQVVVRDFTFNGNSIPDVVMVKDAEDGDVVLSLVTALTYIENVVCAARTMNASFLIYSPGPCASKMRSLAASINAIRAVCT